MKESLHVSLPRHCRGQFFPTTGDRCEDNDNSLELCSSVAHVILRGTPFYVGLDGIEGLGVNVPDLAQCRAWFT